MKQAWEGGFGMETGRERAQGSEGEENNQKGKVTDK